MSRPCRSPKRRGRSRRRCRAGTQSCRYAAGSRSAPQRSPTPRQRPAFALPQYSRKIWRLSIDLLFPAIGYRCAVRARGETRHECGSWQDTGLSNPVFTRPLSAAANEFRRTLYSSGADTRVPPPSHPRARQSPPAWNGRVSHGANSTPLPDNVEEPWGARTSRASPILRNDRACHWSDTVDVDTRRTARCGVFRICRVRGNIVPDNHIVIEVRRRRAGRDAVHAWRGVIVHRHARQPIAPQVIVDHHISVSLRARSRREDPHSRSAVIRGIVARQSIVINAVRAIVCGSVIPQSRLVFLTTELLVIRLSCVGPGVIRDENPTRVPGNQVVRQDGVVYRAQKHAFSAISAFTGNER